MTDMGLKSEVKELDDKLYAAMGLDAPTLQKIQWATKILMVIFVIWASLLFKAYYDDFKSLGCEAYCETKVLGQEEQR